MKPKPQSCPADLARYWQQRGFTLTELMISVALGLLVVASLITLFANISRTNTETAKTNNLIENGRFAMQLLRNDIVHAGFWGEYAPQFDDLTFCGSLDPTTFQCGLAPSDVPDDGNPATDDVPNPCRPYSKPWDPVPNIAETYEHGIFGIPIQVYAGTPPLSGTGTGCITDFTENRQANTDVLVVRHAETATTCRPGEDPAVDHCEPEIAGKLYFQASLCELEKDTPYQLATSPFIDLYKRDCVGTGTPPDDSLPITLGTIADKRKFISNIYYIRVIPDPDDPGGPGIPNLMRSTFDLSGGTLAHQAAEPLIEGIEGFRVELGIDSLSETGAAVDYDVGIQWQDEDMAVATNRGDGSPDGAFVSCTDAAPCTVDQLINVTAVKLYVLARAKKPTPGYTDDKTYALGSQTMCRTGSTDSECDLPVLDPGFKRHVFSTTIRLANVSGRRDTR